LTPQTAQPKRMSCHLRYRLHNAAVSWMRAAGILSAFLCGAGHRQNTRRCATIRHPCFKEVRCVRIGLFAKACVRVHAHGGRLHAIGGGPSEPCFAVAFCSDGKGMVRPSGSRTECGYSDGKRILRVEASGVTWPARELRDSNCQRRCELAIICFLKVGGLRTFDPDMRGRHVAGIPRVTYLLRRPFVSP
jgi:hypothetical protein